MSGRPEGRKRYQAASAYETKLKRVMERLGVEKYNYNWDRHGCWVEFTYKGEGYRFDHSVEKAQARRVKLSYGSDCLAQVVLSLEDLARMVERGIYDLQTWVAGMKFLPPVREVPSFLKALGFSDLPASAEEVRARYHTLAKQLHPDAGGSEEDFKNLKAAAEQGIRYMATVGGRGEDVT